MKKQLLAIVLSALAVGVQAATVEHDVAPANATHCGYFLDSAPKLVIQVTPGPVRRCLAEVTNVTPGTHSVIWTYMTIDPVWGSSEGPQSSPPFSFAKPSATPLPAPSNANTRLVN